MITPPIDFARLALSKAAVAIGEDEVKAAVVRRVAGVHRAFSQRRTARRVLTTSPLRRPLTGWQLHKWSGSRSDKCVPNVGDVVVVLYHLLIAGPPLDRRRETDIRKCSKPAGNPAPDLNQGFCRAVVRAAPQIFIAQGVITPQESEPQLCSTESGSLEIH